MLTRETPKPRIVARTLLALLALAFVLSLPSQAQSESAIYDFVAPGHDGHTPNAGVVSDAAGNLYGTTVLGGTHNSGTVFELSPVTGGGWSETVIYSFTGGLDGGAPETPVILDAAGNVYGTAVLGGSSGQGVAFELAPTSGGGWHETVLHSFTGGIDGSGPGSSLVFDVAGNLYGTAEEGGSGGGGTIFELSPTSRGVWHFTILHGFSGGTDGRVPYGTLIFDAAGSLYGTTGFGGIAADCVSRRLNGCGVVFEFSPVAGGGWHESILHGFTGGHDGAFPLAGLVFDASGNLYGTTYAGGDTSACITLDSSGCGVVFELSPVTGGGWHETTLHSFTGRVDGGEPDGSVVLDSSGNVYGNTQQGGNSTLSACNPNGCGVTYEISPFSGGGWHETVLHAFTGNSDGTLPVGALVFNSSGQLFGAAAAAGTYGQGAIFEITP